MKYVWILFGRFSSPGRRNTLPPHAPQYAQKKHPPKLCLQQTTDSFLWQHGLTGRHWNDRTHQLGPATSSKQIKSRHA